MSNEEFKAPEVKNTTDPYLIGKGQVVRVEFPKSVVTNVEHLTLDQAYKLQARLNTHLWGLRIERYKMFQGRQDLDPGVIL